MAASQRSARPAGAAAAQALLVQFARAPVPGRVKTRMLPVLSAQVACDLHRELVLWTSRRLVASAVGPVELWVDGDVADPLFGRCRDLGVAAVRRQRGGDLGERMHLALRCGLRRHPLVLLVGSDCPAIDGAYLEAARAALAQCEVVLGPATDGGYVLLGARQPPPRQVFEGIPWGADTVYSDTTAILNRLGIRWRALSPLADIDRPDDLARWRAIRDAGH